jgi:hypothetical protein
MLGGGFGVGEIVKPVTFLLSLPNNTSVHQMEDSGVREWLVAISFRGQHIGEGAGLKTKTLRNTSENGTFPMCPNKLSGSESPERDPEYRFCSLTCRFLARAGLAPFVPAPFRPASSCSLLPSSPQTPYLLPAMDPTSRSGSLWQQRRPSGRQGLLLLTIGSSLGGVSERACVLLLERFLRLLRRLFSTGYETQMQGFK